VNQSFPGSWLTNAECDGRKGWFPAYDLIIYSAAENIIFCLFIYLMNETGFLNQPIKNITREVLNGTSKHFTGKA
jgi:hypothetical protein